MLICRGVTKRFGGIEALAGIDLAVARGEFVSLIGPSGCGKSTLLAILAGIELPTSGEGSVDGHSVVGRPGAVAYMPQRDTLLPWLRTIDNAALPLKLRGLDPRDARDEAARLLPRFGLAGFEQSWPRELSGGMRHRAALLRTYLVGREMLLLDEPLGSLDALTRQSMQEWLLGIWEESRRTILLVTHDVDEALFLSDRVCVMSPRPGRIVADVEVPFGRPRDFHLLGDPAFGRLKEELLGRLRADPPATAAHVTVA